MAYIDDNNDLAAGKGKDPLKELDDELEQLLAELNQMDLPDEPEDKADEKALTDTKEAPDKAPVKASGPKREDKKEEDHFDVEAETDADEEPEETSKPRRKKKSKAPVIIGCIIIAAIVAGCAFLVWYFFNHRFSVGGGDKTETEQFYDPELGTVPVKKVEGASLNTYDTANLVKNANGYYEYYVDGELVSETGVDLSAFQNDVDFAAVKNSGVDYVILRIGGRSYSDDGELYTDDSFDTYYQQAKDAGLKVGAYFFSQAISTDEAVEEAKYVVEKLGGRSLDYPVAYDWEAIDEDDARTDRMGGKTITAMAEAFCDTIEDEGYHSLVYASTSLMLQSYDFETMKDYNFWLADYREFPNMYYDFVMWQYDKEATVDGIEGNADLNICFKPY